MVLNRMVNRLIDLVAEVVAIPIVQRLASFVVAHRRYQQGYRSGVFLNLNHEVVAFRQFRRGTFDSCSD